MPSRTVRSALALGAVLLAGCGVIPTPVVALRDTTVPLANTFITQGKVVYVDQDELAGATLPAALRGLTVHGDALYNSSGGNLGTVKLFVRSTPLFGGVAGVRIAGNTDVLYT